MSLTQFRKISTILSVGPETTVTLNNIGMTPCTGPVFKCIVENLNKLILPSPTAGNTQIFQGIAKLINSAGDIGVFMLVAANPTNSAVGGLLANEVWLAKGDSTFWEAEVGISQANDMTIIQTPLVGMKICFDTITGANPNVVDSITPLGWSGPIISPTLRSHRADVSEDMLKLAKQISDIAGFDLSTLLKTDHTLFWGGNLTWTSGLSVNIGAGRARYKGIEFDYVGGSLALPAEKTLYKICVNQNGTYFAQEENSTGGTLDSDYNPSGTSPLPNAMPVNAWGKVGTGVDSVASGILTMTQNAQVNAYYQRLGVVGPSAVGSFVEISFAELTDLQQPFSIVLDDGVNREIIDIFSNGEIRSRNNNRRRCNLVDIKKPFKIGLSLKSGVSKLYINGGFAWSNSAGSTSANLVAFGYIGAGVGNSQAKISRVRFWNAGERNISFPYNEGAVLGTVMTSTNSFIKPVGIMERGTDVCLNNLNLDGVNRENIGKVYYTGNSQNADDELILVGYTISRNDFASLFFHLGTRFGAGDGINTFTIPNSLDRMLIGAGGSYADGVIGGATTHTLSWNEMPVHTHQYLAPTVPQNVWGTMGSYSPFFVGNANSYPAGSGWAHNNMPPYLALLPVIKFK